MQRDTPTKRARIASDFQVSIVAYAAALLLIAGAVAAAWLFYAISLSAERQNRLGDLVFAERDALLQLVNQETGIRGCVATGDSHFLEIYYLSRDPLERDIRTIERSSAVYAPLRPRIDRFLRDRGSVQRYFDAEISLLNANRRSLALAQLGFGKQLFDTLRASDASVSTVALAEREHQRSRTLFLSRAGTIVSGVFCIAVLALAGAFMLLSRRSRAYRASSLHDPLTGAGNREYALRRIGRLAREGVPFGVVFIDLDGFKKINDNYGHATGDEILKAVVSRMRGELREGDAVCRLGGDEFVCVATSPAKLETIAHRLQKAVNRPYRIGDEDFVIGSSAGFAAAEPGTDAASLLRRADRAMYDAKGSGGGVRAAQPS